MDNMLFLGFGSGIVVGGLVAWVTGVRRGGRRLQAQVAALTESLRKGEIPRVEGGSAGEASAILELRRLLARGWLPRGRERDAAIRQALGRIAVYLRRRVEAPLLAGLEGGGQSLREGADAALDAVEDLEFFLEDIPSSPTLLPRNLLEVVREVTKEFATQSPVLVKVDAPDEPIRVRVEPESLKDAVFLVLHNAGDFGGGKPVSLTLSRAGGKARLGIRDQGPGFTAEALLEAMNPLYTTSAEGLGMGLHHARRVVEAQGGEILLRNPEGGGAEVEIVLPETV
jgi:signal transduction histidine kinase